MHLLQCVAPTTTATTVVAGTLLQGILGEKLADYMAAEGGLITLADLKEYSIAERYESDAD